MARLSRRLSRYFSLSRRRTQTLPHPAMPSPSTSPKIDKAQISKPILSERETNSLLSSYTPTHTYSSSAYTISNAELRRLEEEKLSRRLEDAIDDILASYQAPSTPTPHVPTQRPRTTTTGPQIARPTNPFADPSPRPRANTAASSSPTPSSSSVYSSPPPSPPTISAKLERFRDTPPPAPGWEKIDFGRKTRLFGPEGFVDLDGGGRGRVHGGKDWRGEFGRKGYAVL